MPVTADARASEPPVLDLTVAEAIERARSLSTRGTRVLLGITGPPGAGKSTLSEVLLDQLGGLARGAPMDGFHLANDVLVALGRRDRKGAADTFDVAGYAHLLRRLKQRDDDVVYAPRFERSIETAIAGALPIPSAVPLVIAEGNYLLHEGDGWGQIRDLLDEVWFLDVAADQRVERLVGRRVSHGHPAHEAAAWVTQVDERNTGVVMANRSRADLILRLIESGEPTPRPVR